MAGTSLARQGVSGEIVPRYYSVQEAVFPFIKFPGSDIVLGPEMRSTGEVMGIAESFGEAFGKTQLAMGAAIPRRGAALISVKDTDHQAAVPVARYLVAQGFTLYATKGTAARLEAAGVAVERVNKVAEGRPHVVDMIKNDEIEMVVNTTAGKQSLKDSYTIRRAALQHKVTYFTTLASARAACEAHRMHGEVTLFRLQDLRPGGYT